MRSISTQAACCCRHRLDCHGDPLFKFLRVPPYRQKSVMQATEQNIKNPLESISFRWHCQINQVAPAAKGPRNITSGTILVKFGDSRNLSKQTPIVPRSNLSEQPDLTIPGTGSAFSWPPDPSGLHNIATRSVAKRRICSALLTHCR